MRRTTSYEVEMCTIDEHALKVSTSYCCDRCYIYSVVLSCCTRRPCADSVMTLSIEAIPDCKASRSQHFAPKSAPSHSIFSAYHSSSCHPQIQPPPSRSLQARQTTSAQPTSLHLLAQSGHTIFPQSPFPHLTKVENGLRPALLPSGVPGAVSRMISRKRVSSLEHAGRGEARRAE
jgi:hypothetical protein